MTLLYLTLPYLPYLPVRNVISIPDKARKTTSNEQTSNRATEQRATGRLSPLADRRSSVGERRSAEAYAKLRYAYLLYHTYLTLLTVLYPANLTLLTRPKCDFGPRQGP